MNFTLQNIVTRYNFDVNCSYLDIFVYVYGILGNFCMVNYRVFVC